MGNSSSVRDHGCTGADVEVEGKVGQAPAFCFQQALISVERTSRLLSTSLQNDVAIAVIDLSPCGARKDAGFAMKRVAGLFAVAGGLLVGATTCQSNGAPLNTMDESGLRSGCVGGAGRCQELHSHIEFNFQRQRKARRSEARERPSVTPAVVRGSMAPAPRIDMPLQFRHLEDVVIPGGFRNLAGQIAFHQNALLAIESSRHPLMVQPE
jgi:hypothetical protein